MFSDHQKTEFNKIVLDHIVNQLEEDKWRMFRHDACREDRWADHPEPVNLDATPAELIQSATFSIAVPLPRWRSERLAEIDGVPVFYFPREGVFSYSSINDSQQKLMLWLTHPAYPPYW